MAEVNIQETTTVRGNVYFPGKAFVSDAEAKNLKQIENPSAAAETGISQTEKEETQSAKSEQTTKKGNK